VSDGGKVADAGEELDGAVERFIYKLRLNF
jgi:hypothetical protein